MEPSNVVAIKALTDAVEKIHSVSAVLIESTAVHEEFQGVTAWQGVVSLFELMTTPRTNCYAWSVPASDGGNERFYAVTRTPEVDTPRKAVMASIVSDHRRTHRARVTFRNGASN